MRIRNILSALAICISPPALAFDTGHHWDATQLGMAMAYDGFSGTAKRTTATANWLVDYYTESPASGGAYIAGKNDLANLHFDNLFTEAQVKQTWNLLINNYLTELKAIANDSGNKTERIYRAYALMGITLHAVQDFYTHSNWADFHPKTGNGFSSKTVLHNDLDATIAQSGTLQTGFYPTYYASSQPAGALAHGDYTSGINKDSHMRPHWDEAFVFATIETYRLTLLTINTLSQTNSSFYNDWIKFSKSTMTKDPAWAIEYGKLSDDAQAAYDVSQFIHVSGADGHYKGKYSGNNANFTETAVPWVALDWSNLQIQVLDIIGDGKLTKCLYDWSNGCVADDLTGDQMVGNTPDIKVLSVRIDNIEHTHGSVDPFGNDPDYYAQFDFPKFTMLDRILDNKDKYKSSDHVVQGEQASAFWGIYFVPDNTATTAVKIRVYDYDAESGDDEIDIAHGGTNVDIVFTYSGDHVTGDVPNGVYDTRDRRVTSEGNNGDQAKIKFWVYDDDVRD